MNTTILRTARTLAHDLARAGAQAVVLTGSHARGAAGPHSDIDLIAVFPKLPADQPAPYRMRSGILVAVASTTPRAVRAAFRSPERATTYVPGWRDAIILHDPDAVAAKLKRTADRWTWATIGEDNCDQHVAESIAGLAEEVHKLAGLYAVGNVHAAAAQRSILAVWLAGIMAVHHRLLFATDNALWDAVAAAMGEPWASTQSRALSESGEPLVDSCAAALELYRLAVAAADPLFDRHQRSVVKAASQIQFRPPPKLRRRHREIYT